MWIKKIGTGILIIGLVLVSNGCIYKYGEDNKKIILEEDVRENLKQERNMQVKVQQLELNLGERTVFNPVFYYNEEIYGSVGNGVGRTESKDFNEYPIDGMVKDRLYCLDKNNILKETNKKVFTYPYNSKMIGYENASGKIVSIDYLKEKEPNVLSKLSEALNTIEPYDNLIIEENIIDGNKKMFTILANIPFKNHELYFYDVENSKLYKRKGEIQNEDGVCYVPKLKSFVYIDKNYKCYKVVFEGDTFDFKEYIDLSAFLKTKENTKDIVNFIPINEEEVLLMELGHLGTYGYETKMISTFNFTTNKYNELFVSDKTQHIFANYIGTVTSIGGPSLIIDTFEKENEYIKPKERYFKKIYGNQLKTLYTENINNEGLTLDPRIKAVVSKNGKEIFLKKELTEIKDEVETTKSAIYKKYIFG